MSLAATRGIPPPPPSRRCTDMLQPQPRSGPISRWSAMPQVWLASSLGHCPAQCMRHSHTRPAMVSMLAVPPCINLVCMPPWKISRSGGQRGRAGWEMAELWRLLTMAARMPPWGLLAALPEPLRSSRARHAHVRGQAHLHRRVEPASSC